MIHGGGPEQCTAEIDGPAAAAFCPADFECIRVITLKSRSIFSFPELVTAASSPFSLSLSLILFLTGSPLFPGKSVWVAGGMSLIFAFLSLFPYAITAMEINAAATMSIIFFIYINLVAVTGSKTIQEVNKLPLKFTCFSCIAPPLHIMHG